MAESGSSKKVTGSQIAAFIESEVSSGPSFTGQASFDDGSAAARSIAYRGKYTNPKRADKTLTRTLRTVMTRPVPVPGSIAYSTGLPSHA